MRKKIEYPLGSKYAICHFVVISESKDPTFHSSSIRAAIDLMIFLVRLLAGLVSSGAYMSL